MKLYNVYVIELSSEVLNNKKFKNKNPGYLPGNKCYYIGQSYRSPELRFVQHKEGYKSNRFAKEFGLRLRHDIFKRYNPIPTRSDALEIENYLTNKLRLEGNAVWSN